ncbi:MAG: Holliday junction resolvase-like protein [bacterium]|nr:Holliday junction resolvase-like protein [bacterium]
MVAKLFFVQRIKSHRQQAVSQSRSVTLGYVSEAIAPLLPNFPYHYKDMVFLGKGVDYLVFDGLHLGEVPDIIFLEVKTNTSQLNKNERLIKQAIDA